MNKNAEIEQKIAEIYHENDGNDGYRRIRLVLKRIWTINHKKVQEIMPKLGLKGKCKHRKYRSYLGEVGKIADNLLARNFHATKPNKKWVTDVSEFKCTQSKHYPTKVGSISWLILEKFANETASAKVCREKDIAWIIVQWTVFSGD